MSKNKTVLSITLFIICLGMHFFSEAQTSSYSFILSEVSADGSLLATVNYDKTIQIWDIAQNQVLRVLQTTDLSYDVSNYFSPQALEFNHDDSLLAVGYITDLGASLIDIFEVNTGQLVRQIETEQSVLFLAWEPSGNRIAGSIVGDFTMDLQIWDANNGSVIYELPFGVDSFSDVQWSPDGSYLAYVGIREIVILDSNTYNRLIAIPNIEMPYMGKLSWSPDSTKLSAVGKETLVRIFDASTGDEMSSFHKPNATETFSYIKWSGDDGYLATLAGGTPIEVWNTQTLEIVATIPVPESIIDFYWLPNGNILYVDETAFTQVQTPVTGTISTPSFTPTP
jgi:WD40 repeat protein